MLTFTSGGFFTDFPRLGLQFNFLIKYVLGCLGRGNLR